MLLLIDGLRNARHVRFTFRDYLRNNLIFHFILRDGLTAVREIRRMEESGELPVRSRVFALTVNAREGQVESAREAGMDEVIVCFLFCSTADISLHQHILLDKTIQA